MLSSRKALILPGIGSGTHGEGPRAVAIAAVAPPHPVAPPSQVGRESHGEQSVRYRHPPVQHQPLPPRAHRVAWASRLGWHARPVGHARRHHGQEEEAEEQEEGQPAREPDQSATAGPRIASGPPPPPCVTNCGGKSCGDDGCGGSCGTCGSCQSCQGSTCGNVADSTLCPGGFCQGGSCVPCGASGQTCCPGNICGGGQVCASLVSGKMCVSSCGGPDERCCANAPGCEGNLFCCPTGGGLCLGALC
jgi:hypothetical protein